MCPFSYEQARHFYDQFGTRQDKQRFYEEPAIAKIIEHGRFGNAKRVFEFGCGTGSLALELLTHHLPPSAHYVAVDISKTMIDIAKSRLQPYEERVAIRQTDGPPVIAEPDASFDRFISTYVLDLLAVDDIRALLKEAHRILQNAGLLCLCSLTFGPTCASRVVTASWNTVHRLRPQWVGGCRPLRLLDYLVEPHWEIVHHSVVTPFGIASEAVVAERQPS